MNDSNGTLSKATTAPQTKRGTVSKDDSDDEDGDDGFNALAESQTRRMAESLKCSRPGMEQVYAPSPSRPE